MLKAFSGLDWDGIAGRLSEDGYAVTEPFLSPEDCSLLQGLYGDPECRFRSVIDMARHNFGRGEYKYFDYPLPSPVAHMREFAYGKLAMVANEWQELLSSNTRWPSSLEELTRHCQQRGQNRPTPLMLRYGAGDYNCLHQDLYGPVHFPLQVILLLSEPGTDFTGGELLLVEQRPRMQSKPIVLHPQRGAAAIIPVRERPRRGSRGYHRAMMRHGVGEVLSGERYTLGIIFHDAA